MHTVVSTQVLSTEFRKKVFELDTEQTLPPALLGFQIRSRLTGKNADKESWGILLLFRAFGLFFCIKKFGKRFLKGRVGLSEPDKLDDNLPFCI
jgi:hypothetical protein